MLLAGVARVDITPPLPVDLMGYVRRWRPASRIVERLCASALVLERDRDRLVFVTADMIGMSPSYAREARRLIAAKLDTSPAHVMINISHSHAAPYAGGLRLKLGGDMSGIRDSERAYDQLVPHHLVSAAYQASLHLEPVTIGATSGRLTGLSVNRRERTSDGRTILGWNPDGPLDDTVSVIRADRMDGSPLALVVNFGCHPVVVGPEDDAVGPDFPGAVRRHVESVYEGANCLFLQGAGGNVLPLEAFFDEAGPEEEFGRRLAVEALHLAESIETTDIEFEKLDFGSVTPISRYRRRRAPRQPPTLEAAVLDVVLPLKPIPSEASLVTELEDYQNQLNAALDAGVPQEEINPLRYHVNWAEDALCQLREDGPYDHVLAELQAFRIGDIGVVGVPGEVFSEIALAVRADTPFTETLFAGYTNGLVSYLPSAAEYAFGGYEVDYAHHGYGLLEQVDETCEGRLVEGCLGVLNALSKTPVDQ